MRACGTAFSEGENALIKQKTDNLNLYTWWSDLPVYKREHLPDFFSRLTDISQITYFHFDHLLYSYYLLANHDFKVVNITPLTGVHHSLEYLYTDEAGQLGALRATGFGFGWLSRKTFEFAPNYYLKQGTFMLNHLNRMEDSLYQRHTVILPVVAAALAVAVAIANPKGRTKRARFKRRTTRKHKV